MMVENNIRKSLFISFLLIFVFQINALAEDGKFGFTFKPHGDFLLLQQIEPDTGMGWIYSAGVIPEIAGGKGHSIRFGVAYENRAGYDPSQSITFFDPIFIDSWQILSWQYRIKNYGTVYVYMRRVCLHAIDMHNSGATFWTHSAFGYGNIAPLEKHEKTLNNNEEKRYFNYYISTGPYHYGGPGGLLGNDMMWQWENSLYLAVNQRLNKKMSMMLDCSFDHLVLLPNADKRHRWRGEISLSFITSRENGQIILFVTRQLHDDYLMRNIPVGTRVGIKYSS